MSPTGWRKRWGCRRRRRRHRARQRLWRVRRAADGDPPSRHRGQTDPRRLRRGVLGSRPRGLPQHGGGVKGQGAGRDHRCRDAPAVRAGISGAASRPDARPPRGISENRSGRVSGRLRAHWPNSTCGPSLPRSRSPVLVLVGEHDEATPPPMSHELAAGLPNARLHDHCRDARMSRSCKRPGFFWKRSAGF